MKDEDKVPSWKVEETVVYNTDVRLCRHCGLVYNDATLADLRRAAEACGYELAISGTTQVSANYVKDVDHLIAERDKA